MIFLLWIFIFLLMQSRSCEVGCIICIYIQNIYLLDIIYILYIRIGYAYVFCIYVCISPQYKKKDYFRLQLTFWFFYHNGGDWERKPGVRTCSSGGSRKRSLRASCTLLTTHKGRSRPSGHRFWTGLYMLKYSSNRVLWPRNRMQLSAVFEKKRF